MPLSVTWLRQIMMMAVVLVMMTKLMMVVKTATTMKTMLMCHNAPLLHRFSMIFIAK